MEFVWGKIGQNGHHLQLVRNNVKVGEALIWNDYNNGKKIRINSFMINKKRQGNGLGKKMLEEIKNNIRKYFPDVETLQFDSVTSLGMLRLIESVFFNVEWHICDLYSERFKQEILNKGIDLPEDSPAKYHRDGSCKISKRAKKEHFTVSLI